MATNPFPPIPPMPQPQQPGPFGSQWKPTAVDWGWMRLQAIREDGLTEQLHVLILHTQAGLTGVAFTKDALERFIKTAQVEASGLHLPGTN